MTFARLAARMPTVSSFPCPDPTLFRESSSGVDVSLSGGLSHMRMSHVHRTSSLAAPRPTHPDPAGYRMHVHIRVRVSRIRVLVSCIIYMHVGGSGECLVTRPIRTYTSTYRCTGDKKKNHGCVDAFTIFSWLFVVAARFER